MSEEKKASEPIEDKAGEELSSLLDSALEDFLVKEQKPETQDKTEDSSSTSVVPSSQEWSNDFVQQVTNQFEDKFSDFLTEMDPNAQVTPELLQQKLQQMADAAQQALENPSQLSDNSSDFASSISQAIQGLSAGTERLQEPHLEDELMKMFSGSGEENKFLPFMQGMMQGLLSKEVLGPSLEDFVQRLPPYIEENKEKLSKEDIERYENQKKLMEQVLTELNTEKETDSSDVKKERFTKVLSLMQKLQDYGQPPAELVGNVEAPFNFDPQGNPVGFPDISQPNQECSIM